MDEQCQDIRTDLSSRVQPFISEHVDSKNRFLLASKISFEWDLIARESLYEWASSLTDKHQVSYDLWKNVISQLRDYPESRQWTLPLGSGWYIVRSGDALEVVGGAGDDQSFVAASQQHEEHEQNLPWHLVDDAPEGPFMIVRPVSRLESHEDYTFVKTTAGARGTSLNSWQFTPPWRDGSSPSKLGSFLRGQKVPLHLRESTPIIVCRRGEANQACLVAVQVGDKWVVNAAAWKPRSRDNEEGNPAIAIHLT